MRQSIVTNVVLGGSLLSLVVWMTGCGTGTYWGCDATATCVPPAAGAGVGTAGEAGSSGAGGSGGATSTGVPCPDDPAQGEVGDDCGVFVSSTLGDDGNSGTRELPVKTLTQAITLAEKGRRRVYACAEKYPERVTLAGVSLYGGFDCQHDWSYDINEDQRAEIQAPPAPAVLTLGASETLSWISDVRVIAPAAITPGGSSIAVLVKVGSDVLTARGRMQQSATILAARKMYEAMTL